MIPPTRHLFLISVIGFLLACTQANNSSTISKPSSSHATKDQAFYEDLISQASQFAIGLVGFAGKISTEETAMRDLARQPQAEFYFSKILSNPLSTIEGKLYALCGLKLIDSKQYPGAVYALQQSGEKFSTFYGDILKKENVNIALNNIETSECSE